MRVLLTPAQFRDGCHHWRLAEPMRVLNSPDVREEYNHQYQMVWQVEGQTLNDILDPPEEDVIVLQRVMRRETYELMRVLQDKHNKAVVVETDDDFHSLPVGHSTRYAVNEVNQTAKVHKQWIMKACNRADLVTVTTEALRRRYGTHGRCAVLPNYVSRDWFDYKKYPHKGVWVGWSGSVKVHIGDLDVVGGGVGAAIGDTKAQFRVVGSPDGVAEALGLTRRPTATGWVSLERYPRELAQLDVGICPLEDNVFNSAKSSLKPIEMSALGVVPIMSPSAEYQRLHDDYGIGVIAKTPGEWYGWVRALIEQPELRAQMAEAGRQAVRTHLVLENHAHKWMTAWGQARDNADKRLGLVDRVGT